MHNKEKLSSFSSTKIIEEYNHKKASNTETSIKTNKKYIIGKASLILNRILIKFIIFSTLFFEFNQRKIHLGLSSINLKANGIGDVKVLSDEYHQNLPDEVWINNIRQSKINNTYNLKRSENFITLKWYEELESLENMFSNCYNITEINFSDFDTSQVTNMLSMFSGCSSLTSLDLSNFDTSQVRDIGYMFRECYSLVSLNLSNFNTSHVKLMDYTFSGCSSLISLDLSNFNTSQVRNMRSMFSNCSSLISLDLLNFDINNEINVDSMFSGCKELNFINLENAILNDSNIFNSASDNLVVCTNKFFNIFSENITLNCINKTQENENKINCYTSKKKVENKYICQKCGSNFYQKYDEINDYDIDINCYEPKDIYCPYYFYINITSKIIYCTNNNKCPNDYPKLVSNRNECVEACENEAIYKYEFDNKCYNKKVNQSVNDIIQNMLNEFNITDINNGNDKIISEKNIIMIFTSTQNQRNNENISNLTMNLGQCEKILKDKYIINNIPNGDSLYMLQLIYEDEGKKIPKLEYEIYYPLNNSNNLTKLNLSLCQGTKIEISIAVKINEPIDKYNASSDYYNDICSKSSSSSGTDISLKDRRNEFFDNNMYLCEENCDLIDYNYYNQKSKCSCDIKLNISSNFDVKFDKNEFLNNFIDINNIMNLNIMKCYKIVFQIKYLMKNYGFFIIVSIILLYFITLFIFVTLSYNKINKKIDKICFALNAKRISTQIKNTKNQISNKSYQKKIREKICKFNGKKKKNGDKLLKNNKKKFGININENQNKKDESNNKINININTLETVYENSKKKNNILEKKDFEINSLNYEEAIKIDHRSFCEYYISLLKYNHPLFFSFGTYDDYNSKIIKIFLFFFSFSSELTINALFFNDDTMHKIYQDRGEFDIIYNLPQIIYSTLISYILDILIKFFALSQNYIVQLKNIKNKINLNKKRKRILHIIKIRLSFFFMITLFILLILLYYITCFCGIYINTQSHLIKDSVYSLITSFLISFVYNIFPSIFRFLALSVKKPKRKCLYNLSIFLAEL